MRRFRQVRRTTWVQPELPRDGSVAGPGQLQCIQYLPLTISEALSGDGPLRENNIIFTSVMNELHLRIASMIKGKKTRRYLMLMKMKMRRNHRFQRMVRKVTLIY